MIVTPKEAKTVGENDEKRHPVSDALKAIAPGVPAVSTIAKNRVPFIEPTTAKFLP